jgi:hypothetical protein
MAGEALFSYNPGNEGTLVRLNITIETSESYKTHLAPTTVAYVLNWMCYHLAFDF